MPAPAPTVSVVIPCYNGAAFLRETLDSVLAQTHAPLEVIVVDDGSTDDSAAIAESYGPPVRVIRQRNQGESVARNRGIDEARGDWIAFIDSDDVWKPGKLERQLAAAQPDVVCLHSEWYCFGERDYVSDVGAIPPEERYRLSALLMRGNSFNISTMIVRRSLPVRFPAWTRHGEDLIYCLDLVLVGRLVLVPERLSGIRFHARSQSAAPDMYARWHESFDNWVCGNREALGPGEAERLRNVLLNQLLEVAWAAYWKRDWRQFHALRDYFKGYRGRAEVDTLLRQRIYAPWIYTVKDCFDGILCRGTRRAL